MTKKVSLKYNILCLRSVTSTIHTSHLEYMYMYIQVVLYLLFRLQSGRSKCHHWKWPTNFKDFILHVFSLEKLQWNEKKLIFKITTDVYFSYSSSKTKKKNVNLIFGHCCSFSHPIHLVSTIMEMQQHLNKVNNRIHANITCRAFDPSLINKTTVTYAKMQTTQKDSFF